jgi:hypothetical protein
LWWRWARGGGRDGREVLHAVHPDQSDEVDREMTRISEAWDRRLAAIKRPAESAQAKSEADQQ